MLTSKPNSCLLGKLVNDKEDTIKGLHKEREKKKEEYNKVSVYTLLRHDQNEQTTFWT